MLPHTGFRQQNMADDFSVELCDQRQSRNKSGAGAQGCDQLLLISISMGRSCKGLFYNLIYSLVILFGFRSDFHVKSPASNLFGCGLRLLLACRKARSMKWERPYQPSCKEGRPVR